MYKIYGMVIVKPYEGVLLARGHARVVSPTPGVIFRTDQSRCANSTFIAHICAGLHMLLNRIVSVLRVRRRDWAQIKQTA